MEEMMGITCKDGTANTVRAKVGDTVLKGVTKIEINPIVTNEFITARITVELGYLDLNVDSVDMQYTDTVLNLIRNINLKRRIRSFVRYIFWETFGNKRGSR